MSVSESKLADQPSEIGGYEVIRTLAPGQSWLTTASGGRLLVLKSLDDDCLWKGQLHPNIKDRLGRVRELAHVGVANLYGVERDKSLTFTVWEYLHGDSFEDFAKSAACSTLDFINLARELVLSVEMLHARGIVHGAIKASNVFISADGRVQLTHVSPWLYTDPSEDVRAILSLLSDLASARSEADGALGRLLNTAEAEEPNLRRLAASLGAMLDAREGDIADESDRKQGRQIRRRTLLGAGATVLLGIVLFGALRHYAAQKTPQAPVPPQATPAALQPISTSRAPVREPSRLARADRGHLP